MGTLVLSYVKAVLELQAICLSKKIDVKFHMVQSSWLLKEEIYAYKPSLLPTVPTCYLSTLILSLTHPLSPP